MMTIPTSCNVLMTLTSSRGGGQKWCLWWDVFSLKVDLAWGAVDRTCYFLPRPTKRSWTPVQLSSSSWRNKSILYLVPPKGYVLNNIAGALRSRIHHILIWNKEYIHCIDGDNECTRDGRPAPRDIFHVEKGGFPTPPGPVKQWTHPSGPTPPCPTIDLVMECYFLTPIIKSHEHNCYLVIFAVFSYYFVMV